MTVSFPTSQNRAADAARALGSASPSAVSPFAPTFADALRGVDQRSQPKPKAHAEPRRQSVAEEHGAKPEKPDKPDKPEGKEHERRKAQESSDSSPEHATRTRGKDKAESGSDAKVDKDQEQGRDAEVKDQDKARDTDANRAEGERVAAEAQAAAAQAQAQDQAQAQPPTSEAEGGQTKAAGDSKGEPEGRSVKTQAVGAQAQSMSNPDKTRDVTKAGAKPTPSGDAAAATDASEAQRSAAAKPSAQAQAGQQQPEGDSASARRQARVARSADDEAKADKPARTDASAKGQHAASAAKAGSESAAQATSSAASSTAPAPSLSQAQANPAPATANGAMAGAAGQSPGSSNDGSDDALNTARITRGLNTAVQQKNGSLTLRLTPPEMGIVRVQVQIQGASVQANLHAETGSAHQLLNQQLTSLRDSLQSQGLHVERLTVQPMHNGAGSSASQNQADQGGNDGRSRGQYANQNSQQQQGGQQQSGGDRYERQPAFNDWLDGSGEESSFGLSPNLISTR